MGPEVMIASAVLGAGATALGAVAQSKAMKSQAAADQQRAAIEGDWLQRRALDERAVSQRAATQELRKAQVAQSRLTAQAGGSGAGQDGTVMDLWSGIEKEGQYNAAAVQTAGEQKSAGMNYQANLDRWTADTNASIKRSSANSTLIGGLLSAAGQGLGGYANTRMSAKYASGDLGTSGGGTGYGGYR